MCTNTTIYRETAMDEIEEMLELLDSIGVDGMLLSPGYHYEVLPEKHFLYRQEIHKKFKRVLELAKRYRFYSTPLFLEFAAGLRDYPCTPWGNVTRTPNGWKGPCYLIGDKYFADLGRVLERRRLGLLGEPPGHRCQNCLMHSGFEPSVVRKLGESRGDMWTMAKWNFLG